jgi:hypothetical protein
MRPRVAVYTVVHTGVRNFVADWYRSLADQTDSDFDLWISLDSLSPEEATKWIGRDVRAEWLESGQGDTPAGIRSRALEVLVEKYGMIVLVDSDDMLQESRLAAARSALEISELAGCALRLVDCEGQDLEMTFGLPRDSNPDAVLPQHNVFGFSNSAYRSDLLRRCLPIPGDVVLVDWFLATRAWLMGARLAFDSVVRMDYRQHDANMARVRGPFTEQQVIEDTEMVRRHFRTFRRSATNGYLPERFAELERKAEDVELFYEHVTRESAQLTQYVAALNALALPRLWWVSVAHPALEYSWRCDRKS